MKVALCVFAVLASSVLRRQPVDGVGVPGLKSILRLKLCHQARTKRESLRGSPVLNRMLVDPGYLMPPHSTFVDLISFVLLESVLSIGVSVVA